MKLNELVVLMNKEQVITVFDVYSFRTIYNGTKANWFATPHAENEVFCEVEHLESVSLVDKIIILVKVENNTETSK